MLSLSREGTLEEELQAVPRLVEELFTSGTLVIHITETFLTDSCVNSWVFDTGPVAHICNSMHGLTKSRSIGRGEVDFRVGNSARVAAVAIGTMQLHLPSGFVLELSNCYFVHSLIRNILSPSCLMKDGYSFASKNNGCAISKNNMFVAFCVHCEWAICFKS